MRGAGTGVVSLVGSFRELVFDQRPSQAQRVIRSTPSAFAASAQLRGQESCDKMIILGLNAFHGDSSAALVKDGKLIAAVEEERFCRVKHWAGFPSQSVAYCLREAGVQMSDVDHIALNQDSRANLLRKVAY